MSLHPARLRALGVALAFLGASCASPGPEPVQAPGDAVGLQAATAARLAYSQGDYVLAGRLYRRALERARSINDAGLAAASAYNLAMSEIGLGQYGAAEELLWQAHDDAHRASTPTADIQVLRAKLAYLRTRLPEALALADEVLRMPRAASSHLQARLLRGQVFAELGDTPAAKSELQAAQSLLAASTAIVTPSLRADRAKLEGAIARAEGQMDVAARSFDAEAELLRSAHRYRDMGFALARAADAHLAAQRPAHAAERFFLAARVALGRGDIGAARSLLASSLSTSDKAGDRSARARALMLLEQISRPAAP